ncbi:oligosaccharide flippase family protein [Leptolyngbya sp. AN03gr2]|uniref:oligosaccharide flippase family protein n=1 Tax=unclassified Leptolyngbya TaxID=2650499 RepID=UPI003D30F8A0
MSLRSKVMRGSAYLVFREGLGMLISIGNVLLVTRTIGPTQYGLFATAFGLSQFLQTFGHLGVGVYLIRQEGEQSPRDYHQAFTLLLILGLVFGSIAWLSVPLLQSWLNIDGFAPIFQLLIFFSFLTIIDQAPLAKLERDLEFKRVAWVELLGQLLLFIVSLTLALKGFGAWAPTIAWCAHQTQTCILLWAVSRLRPKLCWDTHRIKEMMSYGLGVSASGWVWYLKTLINPLIVGRFAGETAVGQIALAIRMLDVLSFAKAATYRISIAALAQLQSDGNRLKKAISEGMELQLLALGPILILASWIGPIVFPLLFGEEWIPAMSIFPLLGVTYLTNAAFNLHCSTLYVLRRNWEVTAFHAAYVILFGILAFFLVPPLGISGYAWAEVLSIVTYVVAHLYIHRLIGSPNYQIAAIWWAGFTLAMFSHQLGWWVAGVLGLVFLLPETRSRLMIYLKHFRALKTG